MCTAGAGARVALFARRKQRLDVIVEEFGRTRALACPVDVTDGKECIAGVAQAEDYFGAPVWGLINCAGVMHYQRVLDIDTVSWENQFNVNCKGVLNCCAAVLPNLKAYRRGHIVNITSDAGKKVFTGLAVYSATKFFVEAFAQGLRQELAPLGVKVTNVQVKQPYSRFIITMLLLLCLNVCFLFLRVWLSISHSLVMSELSS